MEPYQAKKLAREIYDTKERHLSRYSNWSGEQELKIMEDVFAQKLKGHEAEMPECEKIEKLKADCRKYARLADEANTKLEKAQKEAVIASDAVTRLVAAVFPE